MFAIGLVIVIYQAVDKGFLLGGNIIGGVLLGIGAFLDWGEDSHQ
jgi:hypothetical protein